jgi:hypothetical protein
MTTSSNYMNNHEEGIDSNAERYFWIVYHLFVLLSSLIGDTLIIIASFQKDALKINKFLVAVIQHIAVSDLASSIVTVLPATVSLQANSWVLGNALCYARVYTSLFTYTASAYFIVVLTASKSLILRYPLRASNWSTKRAHQVCTFLWIFSLNLPIIFLAMSVNDVRFDYRVYNCRFKFSSDASWSKILAAIGFLYQLVAEVAIVVITILTLMSLTEAMKSARRVRGSVPWQGTLAVALTAAVYLISHLPMTVYIMSLKFNNHDSKSLVSFIRISYFLLALNVMSNFYIYTLTIKSFRRYLLSKVLSVIPVHPNNSRNITSFETCKT